MSSSTSDSRSSTWQQLVGRYHAICHERKIQVQDPIYDEASFRSALNRLCRTRGYAQYNKLLAKLRFSSIIEFTNAVDSAGVLTQDASLTALVVGFTFATVQAFLGAFVPEQATVTTEYANSTGAALLQITGLLGDLNSAVPRTGGAANRFSRDPELQSLLRNIFDVYMETLLHVHSCLNTEGSGPNLNCAQNMRAPIDEAKQTFQIESSRILRRWTELVNNEEARAVRDASESHAPTSSSGNEDAAQYAFVRTLGRGSEGSVEEVREVTTGSVFARKQVLFTAYSSDKSAVERKVRNEVEIMKKLKHLHIASVCFWLKTSESCDIYMTPVADDNLFVFLEGCTTSGYDQAKLNMMIPWFGCLLSALAFAQRCHIVHQDIKPSNILIQGGQVYLADFGESKDFSDHETSNPSNADVCGTPIYRAPEVTPSHRRSYPADVFSLGCVFSEMLTVCARRSTADYREARYNKENESPRAFRTSLSRVTKWIRGLDCDEHLEGSLKIQIIPKMLKEDPSQRKTARQLWDLLRQLDSGEDFRLYCTYH